MNQIEIRSKDNPQFRKLKRLLTSKGIHEEKLFLIMGEKLVHEFLAEKKSIYKLQYALSSPTLPFPINSRSIQLSNELFNEVDSLNTNHPMLVCSYEDFPEVNWNETPQGLQIIAPISDPKNMGSLLRSAVGFGAESVILTRESAHPLLPSSIKSSAGAILKIPIYQTPQSIKDIPLIGDNWALDMDGVDIRETKINRKSRLILGEEGLGLPDALRSDKKLKKVSIKTQNIESLNVVVSASIALWHLDQH
jgi:RNA methyltransferase, TrmH family